MKQMDSFFDEPENIRRKLADLPPPPVYPVPDAAYFEALHARVIAEVSAPAKPVRRLAWREAVKVAATVAVLIGTVWYFGLQHTSAVITHELANVATEDLIEYLGSSSSDIEATDFTVLDADLVSSPVMILEGTAIPADLLPDPIDFLY
jgi:hypothetical protein